MAPPRNDPLGQKLFTLVWLLFLTGFVDTFGGWAAKR
jgi:hypothetical protein